MTLDRSIRFCNSCGEGIEITIPTGDNRERHTCPSCGKIQYQNPKIVTGCVPIWQDRILLCRRAIEPRYGLWTVPAGFMENHETLAEGAIRETLEEACAPVNDLQPYGIYNLPTISQVYVMFLGTLLQQDQFDAGVESLEVRLFREDEIPWQEVAFKVVETTLKRYLDDRKKNQFPFLMENLI